MDAGGRARGGCAGATTPDAGAGGGVGRGDAGNVGATASNHVPSGAVGWFGCPTYCQAEVSTGGGKGAACREGDLRAAATHGKGRGLLGGLRRGRAGARGGAARVRRYPLSGTWRVRGADGGGRAPRTRGGGGRVGGQLGGITRDARPARSARLDHGFPRRLLCARQEGG